MRVAQNKLFYSTLATFTLKRQSFSKQNQRHLQAVLCFFFFFSMGETGLSQGIF